jgi:hypothetical protein
MGIGIPHRDALGAFEEAIAIDIASISVACCLFGEYHRPFVFSVPSKWAVFSVNTRGPK